MSQAKTLDEALAMIEQSVRERKPLSVGLLGNAAEILPELVKRGVKPDAVTDQTSAHDPINGYLPEGWTLDEWMKKRESDPKAVERAAQALDGRACARHARLPQRKAFPPSITATISARWRWKKA